MSCHGPSVSNFCGCARVSVWMVIDNYRVKANSQFKDVGIKVSLWDKLEHFLTRRKKRKREYGLSK